jgi:hypothetical protein
MSLKLRNPVKQEERLDFGGTYFLQVSVLINCMASRLR